MSIAVPAIAGLGTPELIIIVLVVLLLFGGKKLPEMARGTGRALRIFKAETKGLMDDDEDKPEQPTSTPQAQLPQTPSGQTPAQPQTPSGQAPAQPQATDGTKRQQDPPPTHTEL